MIFSVITTVCWFVFLSPGQVPFPQYLTRAPVYGTTEGIRKTYLKTTEAGKLPPQL